MFYDARFKFREREKILGYQIYILVTIWSGREAVGRTQSHLAARDTLVGVGYT